MILIGPFQLGEFYGSTYFQYTTTSLLLLPLPNSTPAAEKEKKKRASETQNAAKNSTYCFWSSNSTAHSTALDTSPATAPFTTASHKAQRSPRMLSATLQLEGSFGFCLMCQQWTRGSLFALSQWERAYFKEQILTPIANSWHHKIHAIVADKFYLLSLLTTELFVTTRVTGTHFKRKSEGASELWNLVFAFLCIFQSVVSIIIAVCKD